MKDSELDALLRGAATPISLPERFRQGVWLRIESTASVSFADRLRGLIESLMRPWGMATSLAATLAFGLWLGVASLPDAPASKGRYVESINPFLSSPGR